MPVHSDPVYWQTDELDENVARHMITAMFAVPTVSVDFERLPVAHLRILKAWLNFYQEHKRVLAHGQFRPWMIAGNIPMLLLRHETTAVLGIFADALPPVALPSDITELYVLNAANEACARLWIEGVGECSRGKHSTCGISRPSSLRRRPWMHCRVIFPSVGMPGSRR